jgi:transposase-like protein
MRSSIPQSKNSVSQYSPHFKAEIALAAIKGEYTHAKLASMYDIETSLVDSWKEQAIEGLSQVFASRDRSGSDTLEDLKDVLWQQIGHVKAALASLHKKV